MRLRIASAAALAVGALAFPAAALAYGPSFCNASSCSLANGPNTGYIYTEIPRGAGITMLCWTDAQNRRWFKANTLYGQGYIQATQVANQTSVGHC